MRGSINKSKHRSLKNSFQAAQCVLFFVGLVIVTDITILNPNKTTKFPFPAILCHAYSLGDLNARDIAGIWRLRSTESFLPSLSSSSSSSSSQRPNPSNHRRHWDSPMKEFTVYPKDKPVITSDVNDNDKDKEKTVLQDAMSSTEEPDILLLLTEDGQFVQYEEQSTKSRNRPNWLQSNDSSSNHINTINHVHGHLKGQWAIVDGKLILAKDRPDNYNNLRTDTKVKDTLLSGKIIATTTNSLTPLHHTDQTHLQPEDRNSTQYSTTSRSSSTANASQNLGQNNANATEPTTSSKANYQDVHLAVKGNIKIGKFFYPQTHPNFFEQPMVNAINTGSFELQQILGKLNTALRGSHEDDGQLLEKFRKQDLCDKTYFLTSFPLPKRKKRQRWSIKYNDYVDYVAPTEEEKKREEMEKNEPVNIKTFEVKLFANNTFSTMTGLGDTILRGKWSIIGEERDQLWMTVYRFGFGRSVSGSTFSEGKYLSNQDEVSYWGTIYEVDAAVREDSIEDNPLEWKGTRIEVNGAVMVGIGLEPTSVAKFTMIEKTEEDAFDEDHDSDDDEDDDDGGDDFLMPLKDDIGSFE